MIQQARVSSVSRTLVIGDPGARLCTALRARGHHVECCPDLQQISGAEHKVVVSPTLEGLSALSTTWDLAVAVDGFGRLQEVHSRQRLAGFLAWLSDRAAVVVIEAPRQALAPGLHELGPYLTGEFLSAFPFVSEFPGMDCRSERSDAAPPVLVASRQGLLYKGDWLPSDRLVLLGRDLRESPVSTYRHGDTVFKIERASTDYFERCEASSEAYFLTSVDDDTREALALPRLVSSEHGRAVTTIARQWVPGVPLLPGACRGGRVPLSAVIDFAVRWARAGLFHNDLRPWNLLWDGETISAIDYADAGRHDSDVQGLPQVLALAGTLAALLTEGLPWGEGFLTALLAPSVEAGVGEQWRSSEMLDAPWLSLPGRADALADSLAALTSLDTATVVRTVLKTLMDRHSVGARDA